MLTTRQAAYVNDRIWTSDQDYFYWSSLRGEPFLEGELLHFFDGETLSVVGVPLDRNLEPADAAAQVARTVGRWLPVNGVDFVNYYGAPVPCLNEFLGDSWTEVYRLAPDEYNVDACVDYSDPRVLTSREAREAFRKIRAKDLHVSMGSAFTLGWEHIVLLRKNAERLGDDISDLGMVLAGLTTLRSCATRLTEVRYRERLAGFALSHEFFSGRPFATVACFERSCPGASDALYATLIRHYQQQGARWFNLGYTIDEGLFRYKIKWGGVRTESPFVQTIWRRCAAEREFAGCLHWACRLSLHAATA